MRKFHARVCVFLCHPPHTVCGLCVGMGGVFVMGLWVLVCMVCVCVYIYVWGEVGALS